MKHSCRETTRLIASVCVCVLCMTLCLGNVSLLMPHLNSFFKREISFETMKENITEEFKSDHLWRKYDFVNLYGLFMKLGGKKEINDSVILNNGMLTSDASGFRGSIQRTKHYEELPSFSDYLESIGSKFLYVAAPCKIDLMGTLLPRGLENTYNMQTDNLLDALDAASVETLDLRQEMALDPEQIEKYFYRTDHHWTPDGALVAFQIIMDRLAQDDSSIDTSAANPKMWERHDKENWFLGSRGKRTGAWCEGTDPLIWYTPRFQTSMSCIIPHRKEFFGGDFSEANIRRQYIEQRDFFSLNNYCVYIGGDYPYVKHLNPLAPNKMKLLIIKDSFTLPLQAFMSTSFSEVEVIDPRHYKASEIAEYCMWSKPDIVLMMVNAMSTTTEAYGKMGMSTAPEAGFMEVNKEVLLEDYDVTLENSTSNYHYTALPINIQPGKVYQFSFEDLRASGDGLDGISVIVFDFNTNTILRHQIFDIEYSLDLGDTQWSFKITDKEAKDADIKLLLYAGIHGNTAGKSVTYSGVKVCEI